MSSVLWTFIWSVFGGLSLGWAVLPIPSLSSPVVDQSGVFSTAQKAALENELRSYQKSTGAQIQVLTIPTLDGEAIEDFSIRVVEQWKLGDAQKGNGVLVLLVTQDRKSRIEVGQGLEGDLTDVQSKRILADRARPFFQRGDYATGLQAAVLGVIDQLSGTDSSAENAAPLVGAQGFEQKLQGLSLFEILFWVLFIIVVISPRIFGFRRMGRRGTYYGWGGPSGGWSGGSGWGSGGGGWSGGGGGFSGGGSSDSW